MTAVPEIPVPATELPPAAGTGTTLNRLEVDFPELANLKVQFWACPEEHGSTGIVDWVGDIAHCREPGCGRSSADPLQFDVEVPLLIPPRGHGPAAKLCEPLNANWRLHHMDRASRVRHVREAVALSGWNASIPPGRHLTVTLHYRPGDNRRRDADNLVPTLKAACDALARGKRRDWVGLELVPDDTPEHMTKRMPVIHPGAGERRLWLEIEVTR